MKRNIKLTIEYDGTDFVGWQRQPNGRSVQQVLEEKIEQITQEKISLVGAGRTDSGVHARGQVANFFSQTGLSALDLYRAFNGVLPDDIVIHAVEEVDKKFSARYSAKEREYRYFIAQKPTAIDRKFTWRLNYDLNIPLMNAVSGKILGTHDFRSFCKSESTVDHFLCNVFHTEWQHDGAKLIFTIRANRFLHGMVRAMVGTMVDVGRGFTSDKEFESIIGAKDRTKAGQAAPPQGLFLERVIY
ncbi:MAG: tRNA pseudouridine(38-40) synthase TruA [Ignavibacteriales bacterium]|nr:tRNA pseudouridine(38-40) synthase TruA [Ignavibacteriales bacterium]